MSEEVVLMEKKDHICTITINRPDKRNSLTEEVIYNLGAKLKNIEDARVVVIRGAGEKSFCAGLDLRGGMVVAESEKAHDVPPTDYMREAVKACPCPVIAMIYGYALGAGCDLATACDIRVADDSVKMAINPVKVGGIYWYGGIRNVINIVGLANAKELFYTGGIIGAQRAKETGLVNHLVPHAEVAAKAYGIARDIAANSPLAVNGTKSVINILLRKQNVNAEEIAEIKAIRENAHASEDYEEGMLAFKEKRKPVFKGK